MWSRILDHGVNSEAEAMEATNITEVVKKLQEQKYRLSRAREATDRARQQIEKRRQFTIKVGTVSTSSNR